MNSVLNFYYCNNVVSTIHFHNGLKKGHLSKLVCMFPLLYDIEMKENQRGLKYIA